MTTVSRSIGAAPEEVFAQLADGWIYGAWVVGASHIRDVDSEWPAVGALLHHRVGPWPVSVDDTTEVVAMVPDERLVLRAKAFPFGVARVELAISAAEGGCVVDMAEGPTGGIAKWLDNPLLRIVLRRRNAESLARLDDLASKRPAPD